MDYKEVKGLRRMEADKLSLLRSLAALQYITLTVLAMWRQCWLAGILSLFPETIPVLG